MKPEGRERHERQARRLLQCPRVNPEWRGDPGAEGRACSRGPFWRGAEPRADNGGLLPFSPGSPKTNQDETHNPGMSNPHLQKATA